MLNELQIIREYTTEGLSAIQIANKHNTYPKKIYRILKKHNIIIRDKSEAQSNALEKGNIEHPTLGKKRSKDVKDKISQKLHEHWESLSEEEYQERIDKYKRHWDSISAEDKARIAELAAKGLRKASQEGSKIEKFLYSELINAGYSIIYHKVGAIINDKFEVDMIIPSIKTAIEIDGPSHYLPIWGEKVLERSIKSDAKKNALLLTNGYVVIRIKLAVAKDSLYYFNTVSKILLETLQKIKDSFPDKANRFIELEIKND